MNVKGRHSHLCPDCNLLWQCECSDGWKVQHVTCGCVGDFASHSDVEIPEEHGGEA